MVEQPPPERRALRHAVLGCEATVAPEVRSAGHTRKPATRSKPSGRILEVCFGIAVVIGSLTPLPASARHRHHSRPILAHRTIVHDRRVAHEHPPLHVRPGSYTPPFSAYAVDGNSGRVLYGRDENEARHPASLTKVMTLYLLFEQLDKKRLTLDSPLHVSQHAAAQAPTKLGLRPGSTIRVEDAIKAIVTKSANDMAVAVAEEVGGDEESFARLMTRKAHALGMSHTLYRNASGLPNDEQLTTARDLVTLGRAIHDHFPAYYHYFSTPSFRYAGQVMPNHNHLMEHVEGMDGIKTGYTRASGFNLLTSVKRNGHYLVSVVLGGKTRLGRDRIMADLIEAQLDRCATVRTAAVVEENPALEQVAEAIPVVQHIGEAAPAVEAVTDDEAENNKSNPVEHEEAAAVAAAAGASDPAAAATTTPAAPAAEVASVASDTTAASRARPAFVSGVQKPLPEDRMATGSIRPQTDLDGSTARHADVTATTPSRRALRIAAREQIAREQMSQDRANRERDVQTPAKTRKDAAKTDVKPAKANAPREAHVGWMIQIGATDDESKANDLLSRARSKSSGALGAAKPFTEKVQKGSETLYRARFAGLEANTAESACKTLKRSGFSCFATKN